MALPWLIGGAVLAGAALVGKALSSGDDDDDYENDNGEEERRRREAERERKEREKREKKEAIYNSVMKEGDEQSVLFQEMLFGVVEVSYDTSTPFKYQIDEDEYIDDPELRDLLKSLSDSTKILEMSLNKSAISSLSDLEILDACTLSNLEKLFSFYEVDLSPSQYLKNQSSKLSGQKEQLEKVEQLQEQLSKYKKKIMR